MFIKAFLLWEFAGQKLLVFQASFGSHCIICLFCSDNQWLFWVFNGFQALSANQHPFIAEKAQRLSRFSLRLNAVFNFLFDQKNQSKTCSIGEIFMECCACDMLAMQVASNMCTQHNKFKNQHKPNWIGFIESFSRSAV